MFENHRRTAAFFNKTFLSANSSYDMHFPPNDTGEQCWTKITTVASDRETWVRIFKKKGVRIYEAQEKEKGRGKRYQEISEPDIAGDKSHTRLSFK